jgi:hypothetical protein
MFKTLVNAEFLLIFIIIFKTKTPHILSKKGIYYYLLLCSKQFSSNNTVRNHIIYLHHCQNEIEDFEIFYEIEETKAPEIDSLDFMNIL